MKWNTTKLIATGSLAALEFVISLPIRGIYVGSGTNPLGGIFYLITDPIFDILTLLLIQQFGCVTIKNLMRTLITLPFPHVYPFPFYLVTGPITGLLLDSLFYLLKQKMRLSSVVIGGMDSSITVFFLYLIYITVGYAGAEKLPKIVLESVEIIERLIILFMIIFVIGAVSGYMGYLIYQKIKDTSVVRRIQGN